MTRYKIVLGDWSGDGHSQTDTVYVEIPDIFWPQLLADNFQANVEKFGFDPTETVANEYQDSTISAEHAEVLLDAGIDNGWVEIRDGFIYDYDTYVHILMFFVGHGLDGWDYSIVSEETPLLLGGYSAILGTRSAAYGMFGF